MPVIAVSELREQLAGLSGDILFLACSPNRMTQHRTGVETCINNILTTISNHSSDQYPDVRALSDFEQCCQLVRKWMRDCPLQTLGVYQRWCTDKRASVIQALDVRRQREAQLRQPQCQPESAGTMRCNYVPPGFNCQPIGTQAGVVWYQCAQSQPVITPSVPAGPSTIIPSPPPDVTPIAPGPGGPLLKVPEEMLPEFSTAEIATSSSVGATDVMKKALPWILLIGAGVAAYYLVRKYMR